MLSRHLNQKQLIACNKVGNILVPGDKTLPSFSKSHYLQDIDRILNYLSDKDRKELLLLLKVFYFLPTFFIRFLFFLSPMYKIFPKFLGNGLRLMDIGLKGIFFTLYYSQTGTHQLIGWDAKVTP